MNAQRKFKRLTVALSVAVALLLITVGGLGYTLFRLSKVNLFSKNISLDNTWILEQGETDGVASEIPSLPADAVREEYAATYRTVYDGRDAILKQEMEIADTFEKIQAYSGTYILDVPHLNQIQESLPNGCEAVSATMLLQYNGLSITPEAFVSEHLTCEPVKIRWGCRYGPDPSKAYAGDPHSKKGGWGCFSPVIVNALNDCLPKDLKAVSLTGVTLNELAALYVASDIPVAVWVTQDLEPIQNAYQWQSYDKTETFLYPVNQHCMVLCGFDAQNYYFSDPLSEERVVCYDRQTAEKSYRSMGMQAVAVIKE